MTGSPPESNRNVGREKEREREREERFSCLDVATCDYCITNGETWRDCCRTPLLPTRGDNEKRNGKYSWILYETNFHFRGTTLNYEGRSRMRLKTLERTRGVEKPLSRLSLSLSLVAHRARATRSKVITDKIGWRDSQIGRWPLGCSIVQTRPRRNEIWFCRAISRPNQPPLAETEDRESPRSRARTRCCYGTRRKREAIRRTSREQREERRERERERDKSWREAWCKCSELKGMPEGETGGRRPRVRVWERENKESHNLVKSRTLVVLASLNA